MVNRLEVLEKMQKIEVKREKINYLIKQCESYYIKEIGIDTHLVTNDFNFDGNRSFEAEPKVFELYLHAELEYIDRMYENLFNELKGDRE